MDYYWENEQSNGTYAQQYITGFQYAYDPVTGLKTSATFLDPNSNGTSWVTDHQEQYYYDLSLSYLTTADYNDQYSNPSDTWGYDATGNRLSDADNSGTWSYDNLNRMTASPGLTYDYDVLGNRLDTKNGGNIISSNTWDQLNRMTSFTGGSNPAWSYTYRPDGMRAFKANSNSSTSYAYDGQMGVEDVDSTIESGTSTVADVTDYALGARSVERIAKTTGGATNVAYPIYDGHGNMVSTLAYSGTTFSLGNNRSYDAWGNVRNSDSSGDPKARYCASLGHKQDDESGLIYMRARYYDPGAGRFLSEDPQGSGQNWYTYCSNDPVCLSDFSGANPLIIAGVIVGIIYAIIAVMISFSEEAGTTDSALEKGLKIATAALTGFLAGFACVFGPGAATAASAFGAGLNTLVSQIITHGGIAGVNWAKVGVAFGVGGIVGLAFSAIGAAAGENCEIELELAGDADGDANAALQPGSMAGTAAGMSSGDAVANALYPD
jgi:RHS repeat-associated protein